MSQRKLTLEERFKRNQPLVLAWSPELNEQIANVRREDYGDDPIEYAEVPADALDLLAEVQAEGFFTCFIIRNPRDANPHECNITCKVNDEVYSGHGATLALAICGAYLNYRSKYPKEGEGDCDDRCTNAVGDVCLCPCGGVNHGKNVVK